MSEIKLRMNDDLELHVYHWLPAQNPIAIVHIAHGMAEHAKRYERFAKQLNGAGIAVYAGDHRGHGKSIPAGEAAGHMADSDGWQKAVEDLQFVNQNIAQRHPDIPVILMGHSMGSFMTQDYMAQYPDTIHAAALSATNGPAGTLGKLAQLVSRIEKLRNGNQGHSTLLANMSFKAFNKAFAPNRTEFDWLSRDENEVDKYVADPLCGFDCSIATWIGLLDALTHIASDQAMSKMNKRLPIYVLSGTEDPVGEKTKGVLRLLKQYEKNGFTGVSHKFYQGGRHELLNETNRDEVTTDFIVWVKSVLS